MNELLTINVNEHTEKKASLTYLSWAWAWAEVLKHDPEATWDLVEYKSPEGATLPCMYLGDGSAMVHCEVTIKGITRSCRLPVMDHKNKAIQNPDAFAVNTAMMRCMTKAVSMHGLGLYIYAGEDLPEEPPIDRTLVMKCRNNIAQHVVEDRSLGVTEEWEAAKELGDEFAKQVWAGLTTPERDYIRNISRAAASLKEAA
jgi:Protein of unknown function (DUF1071)